ncbi:helix-turn-helix transcriptional regulator [Actinoallomurus sp. NPDC052308]|uniref:helix-turn-helix domain-containing protein n=1 Tax=Actinoallomurus sp. NPDC052308 TaxID=3155530 RepID=UPI00341B11FD
MAVRRHHRPHPLRAFGNEVRRYRERVGISQAQLADKIPISSSHVGKIERGETRCDRSLAVAMDKILDTREALPSLWDELVKDAAFPTWFDWPEVEANPDTIVLESYENCVVYGLLQTPDYAEALLRGNEAAVSTRLGRQEILRREDPPPPRLCALLTENVLMNEVGNKKIMREQLEHLLTMSSDRIHIHVVPHPIPTTGTDGSFCIATLADRSELGFVETAARGFTLSERDDIQTLSEKFADIRARALPLDLSKDFIRRVMEERWT